MHYCPEDAGLMLVLNNTMVMAVGCSQAAQLQQLSPQLGNCHQEWGASFLAKGLPLKQHEGGVLFMAKKRDQQSYLL